MADWKNINIMKTNVEVYTEKATLINMPKKGNYSGFSFWHPSKLIHRGRHAAALSLGYTDDFKFKLRRYKKDNKGQRFLDSEIEISAAELEIELETMDENIVAKRRK